MADMYRCPRVRTLVSHQSSLPLHVSVKVKLLWVHSSSGRALCKNVLREVCQYLSFFPSAIGFDRNRDEIYLLDYREKRWTRSNFCAKRWEFRQPPNAQWKRLPEMTRSRADFNACRYEEKVYLCSGKNGFTCEVLNLHSLTFRALPEVSQEFSRCLVTTVLEEKLVVVTDRAVYAWRPQGGKAGEWQCAQPLAWFPYFAVSTDTAGKAVYAADVCEPLRFDLAARKWERGDVNWS